MKIKVTRTFSSIRVHMDGVLHLSLDADSLVGVQSWVEYGRSRFHVEYTFADGAHLKTEYDSLAKMEAVLRGLEGVL